MLKAGRIAALDSTANLLKSFSGSQMKLRLDREELPLDFPGELSSRDGNAFVLKLKNFQEVESALAKLREARVEILEMELEPPDLEDVFLRITK